MRSALVLLVLVTGATHVANADGIFPDCPTDGSESCNTGCASQGCESGPVGASCASSDPSTIGAGLGLASLVAYQLGRKRRRSR